MLSSKIITKLLLVTPFLIEFAHVSLLITNMATYELKYVMLRQPAETHKMILTT
jgi:hypothetical protein